MAVTVFIRKEGSKDTYLYKSEVISTNLSMQRENDRKYKAYLNVNGKFDFSENNSESINFENSDSTDNKKSSTVKENSNIPKRKAEILKNLFEWARGNNNAEHYFEIKVVEAMVVEGEEHPELSYNGKTKFRRTEYNVTTIKNAFIVDYTENLANLDGTFEFNMNITYREKNNDDFISFESGNFRFGFSNPETLDIIEKLYGQRDDLEWIS